jgi:hypothetical protein
VEPFAGRIKVRDYFGKETLVSSAAFSTLFDEVVLLDGLGHPHGIAVDDLHKKLCARLRQWS